MSARVASIERTMSQAPDGSNPAEGTSEADYQMVVTHDGTNTSVRFDAGERARGRSNGLIPTLGVARTTVTLNADGEVARVDGVDDMRAVLAEAAQSGAMPASSVADFELVLSDEGQLNNARGAWGNVLSVWHGRTFRCGESQSTRIRTTAHFAASMNMLEMNATLRYVGEVACPSEREAGARCVHLRMEAESDASSLRAAREAWAQATGDPASTPEARVRRAVDLIVEAETLVPHEVVVEEFSELVWVLGEQRGEREIHDISSYRFSYGEPATNIILGTDGVGYQVIRDGRVVTPPDTPECRALTACCGAAASAPNPGSINLMCAMMSAPVEGDDDGGPPCAAAVVTIRQMLVGGGVALPPGCAP